MPSRKFKLALIQMLVGSNKAENLKKAETFIAKAVQSKADVVSLPECFNSPYGVEYFPKYAEPIPGGESVKCLSAIAKKHGIYLVGGSIPEIDGGKYYNTCTAFGPDGSLLAKYRKNHLFDMTIPGQCVFKESDVFSPGQSLATFDTPVCKIGLGICYDMRFPELAHLYSTKGCDVLIYPGAFDTFTGPVHWQLLARARAIDNQMYVAIVSEARDETADYVAYGYSTVATPWGDVLKHLDHKEGILVADIDLDRMEEIRRQIPVKKQRRDDLYTVVNHTN